MREVLVMCLLGSLLTAAPAWARDVATEQYNASQARKNYVGARDEYESLTKQVEAQEQRAKQEQTRLDDLRKQQKEAKTRMDDAHVRMRESQSALDKAWGNK
ncbi:MAG: hypothetical protein LBV44_07170 [Methylobacillus sp.]|jgi:septal ring factor EnvC (AmiA/AmiB activator)|nr:hypothetical protein [Methylobacillus sp.]